MLIRLLALLSTTAMISAGGVNAQEVGANFRIFLQSPVLLGDDTPDLGGNNPTPDPVVISASPAFPAYSQIGSFFSTTLAATGGTPPYVFEFLGAQPNGWTISGDVLSGTFSSLDELDFAVKAVGSEGQLAFSSLVNDADPLVFTGPPGTKYVPGRNYSTTLAATGNDGPATYSVVAGSLPPGLTLSGSTISGTVGSSIGQTGTATIRVADSYSHVDHVLSWSLVAAAADTTIPVSAKYREASTWKTLATHAALRDGNVSTAVVRLTSPNGQHLALDLGSPVEGNSFYVAATTEITYRLLYSDNGTSFTLWGTTRTFSPGNGPDIVVMPDAQTYRYVGLQMVSPTTSAQITEFRYGLNEVFP